MANPSSRQPDTHEESQDSSEYSTGSIQMLQVHANGYSQTDDTMAMQSANVNHQKDELGLSMCTSEGNQRILFNLSDLKSSDNL